MIREKMRDYTRELMRQAHESGSPVIRALFYEFPEDRDCYDITDQYLYGPDVLVCPVCHEGAMSRKVYLPAGAKWISAHDGKAFRGGQTIEVEAPLDTLPIFLRDGKQEYLLGEI